MGRALTHDEQVAALASPDGVAEATARVKRKGATRPRGDAPSKRSGTPLSVAEPQTDAAGPLAHVLAMPRGSVDVVVFVADDVLHADIHFDAVAAAAAHVLRPGGSLFCVVPPQDLPRVFGALGSRLLYRWTFACAGDGRDAPEAHAPSGATRWTATTWHFNGDAVDGPGADVAVGDVVDGTIAGGAFDDGLEGLLARRLRPCDLVLALFSDHGVVQAATAAAGAYLVNPDRAAEGVSTCSAPAGSEESVSCGA